VGPLACALVAWSGAARFELNTIHSPLEPSMDTGGTPPHQRRLFESLCLGAYGSPTYYDTPIKRCKQQRIKHSRSCGESSGRSNPKRSEIPGSRLGIISGERGGCAACIRCREGSGRQCQDERQLRPQVSCTVGTVLAATLVNLTAVTNAIR
jgi:hypothetical protein